MLASIDPSRRGMGAVEEMKKDKEVVLAAIQASSRALPCAA